MNTRNKITLLMAGLLSLLWFVWPIIYGTHILDCWESCYTLIYRKTGKVFLSYFQLYFIALGIIVLVIQKGSINFLFKYFKKNTQEDTQIDKQIDNTTVILLYILSFFIPLAGFIVGAIYASKKEEHYKHVGKNCLIFSVLNIVLSFIMIAVILGSV